MGHVEAGDLVAHSGVHEGIAVGGLCDGYLGGVDVPVVIPGLHIAVGVEDSGLAVGGVGVALEDGALVVEKGVDTVEVVLDEIALGGIRQVVGVVEEADGLVDFLAIDIPMDELVGSELPFFDAFVSVVDVDVFLVVGDLADAPSGAVIGVAPFTVVVASYLIAYVNVMST